MAINLRRKNVQTRQDDEVSHILTPTKQNYNNNLKNILLQTSFGKEEIIWANRTSLVGPFKVEWKILHHNILLEFLNSWKLDNKH